MTVTFFVLGAITIVGIGAAMSLRNLIHCVLALTLGLVGLALLYLSLGAQFVGLTQLLVYVGAVAILAVFAIMTTQGSEPAESSHSLWHRGGLVGGVVFVLLAWTICSGTLPEREFPTQPLSSVHEIGVALMRQFVLPLEIVGLLLTAALIGAAVVAMKEGRVAR